MIKSLIFGLRSTVTTTNSTAWNFQKAVFIIWGHGVGVKKRTNELLMASCTLA